RGSGRADRHVGHVAGDPARPPGRRGRSGHHHTGPARLPHDRRRRGERRVLAKSYTRTIVAALVALVFSLIITSIVLSVSGFNPPSTFQAMFEFGKDPDSIVNTFNKAAGYYLSALAVAVV